MKLFYAFGQDPGVKFKKRAGLGVWNQYSTGVEASFVPQENQPVFKPISFHHGW
jgi:hypothetical protein